MSDTKTMSSPCVQLQAKTTQTGLLRAELRAGRRWNWCGKRGWWLRCCLLNEQEETWSVRRFVATISEACALLNIQEEDWIWQVVTPGPTYDKQQEYLPFLMF